MKIDSSLYPIIVATFAGRTDDDEVEMSIRIFERLLASSLADQEPLFIVCDLRGVTETSATVRKRWAEWVNGMSEENLRAVHTNVLLFRNAFMRGVLTAVGWFSKRVRDVCQSAKDLDGARTVICNDCERTGHAIPSTAVLLTEDVAA